VIFPCVWEDVVVSARVSSLGRRGSLVAAALIALLGLSAPAAGAAPTSARRCAPSKSDTPLNPSSRESVLTGVSVVSSCDVWAAGYYQKAGERDRSLIEHWNGARWTRSPSPNLGGKNSDNQLADIAAVSRNNVWAVGQYRRHPQGISKSVIVHWDGSAWRHFPTPHVGDRVAQDWLSAISARSPRDIWAIGRTLGAQSGPYVLHFDGETWSIIAQPLSDKYDPFLVAVAPVSATDVWVVGYAYHYPLGDRTFVAHWNGAHWIHTPIPQPGGTGELAGVTAIGPHNVWAVGWFHPEIGGQDGPEQRNLVLHWNGTAWTRVSTPTPGLPQGGGSLASVTSTSTGSVWAIGDRFDSASNRRHYLLHRQAGGWRRIGVPDRSGPDDTVFSDLDAASNDAVWAVGVSIVGTKHRTAAFGLG
jgi:hypothetical protein